MLQCARITVGRVRDSNS